jgi:hypothetical protein
MPILGVCPSGSAGLAVRGNSPRMWNMRAKVSSSAPPAMDIENADPPISEQSANLDQQEGTRYQDLDDGHVVGAKVEIGHPLHGGADLSAAPGGHARRSRRDWDRLTTAAPVVRSRPRQPPVMQPSAERTAEQPSQGLLRV